MSILHSEQKVPDFAAWKRMFDSDPAQRKQNGVRSYRISRSVDDPNYVVVDLEFDSTGEAQAFLTRLKSVWQSPQAKEAMGPSTPQVEIIETVEDKTY
jgi:ribosomal protein L35AE/L33A